jgi:hypothetical protein
MALYKGVSKRTAFGSITTAGAANTTVTPAVVLSLDGGSQTSATNAPTHLGNGHWVLVLTATEMNADLIALVATGTGLIPSFREFYTESDWTSAKAALVDASINSRSVYAGGPVASVTGSVGSITGVTFPTNFNFLAIAATTGQVGIDLSNIKQATGATTLNNITVPAVTNVGNVTGSVGSVTGSVGSIAGITFPGNFNFLAIAAATGQVGIDLSNIKQATAPTTLSNITIPTVTTAGAVSGNVGGIGAGGITAASFSADSITAAALAASAVTEIQAGLSTYAGGDTSGTTALLSLLTPTRAARIDYLDASVNSRLAISDYVAPPTVAQIATAVLTSTGTNLSTPDSLGYIAGHAPSWYVGTGGSSGISIEDVQTALSNQGFTITRATHLDFLDQAVSAPVLLDLDQTIADRNDSTVGGALAGAWAVGWGRALRDVINRLLKVWGPGNTTETPSTTFVLDDGRDPSSRTPQ